MRIFGMKNRWVGLALVVGMLGLVACDDSPTDPEHDNDPAEVQLFDRDTGELLVYTHGTGDSAHWDGEFPTLSVGEEIEIDVVFLNDEEEEIALGGEFEARLSLAAGAPTGIIAWANHGDHLDIDAEAAGTTTVTVEFWHDDHADWASPGLDITIVEP